MADSEYKELNLRFNDAAKAKACTDKLVSYGYNRDPVKTPNDRALVIVIKTALEDEVMTIVNAHGGYIPPKPTPVWPGGW